MNHGTTSNELPSWTTNQVSRDIFHSCWINSKNVGRLIPLTEIHQLIPRTFDINCPSYPGGLLEILEEGGGKLHSIRCVANELNILFLDGRCCTLPTVHNMKSFMTSINWIQSPIGNRKQAKEEIPFQNKQKITDRYIYINIHISIYECVRACVSVCVCVCVCVENMFICVHISWRNPVSSTCRNPERETSRNIIEPVINFRRMN